MKIQQEVSWALCGSDISESGDSGSKFEQDEESSSTDEECDMPASADEESKSEKGKKEETVKEKVCVCAFCNYCLSYICQRFHPNMMEKNTIEVPMWV